MFKEKGNDAHDTPESIPAQNYKKEPLKHYVNSLSGTVRYILINDLSPTSNHPAMN